MERHVVAFLAVLRQNGLRVSMAEGHDAVRALVAVGLEDRQLARATLQATLCKRAADVPTFDRAFDLYFSAAGKLLADIEQSLVARIHEAGLLEGDELKMLIATLDSLAGQLSPLTDAALQGDRGRLASLFRGATLQLDLSRVENALQTGFYARRLLSGAGGERMRGDLAAIEDELTRRGLSAEGLEVVSRSLSSLLRDVEAAARAETQRLVAARLPSPRPSAAEKPLNRLSRAELDVAARAVKSLAEKLRSRLTRRARSRRKGHLSVHRTLRASVGTDGVPMAPVFQRRRPHRPEVMVLCDVSDSVRAASRLMLLFTWTLQSLFSRVRSFIFVSDLGEITRQFKDLGPEEALEAGVTSDVISVNSNSNYGRALLQFFNTYIGSVTRRTTVLIIGDGRNNYNASEAWVLEELRRRARRVVWIATEPRSSWGFGDSEMHRYSRAVTTAVVVQTLSDLERVADRLVPT